MEVCNHASRYIDNEKIKILIDAGADVNVKNKLGNTALFISAKSCSESHKHYDIEKIKMLIDAGADVNIKNKCKDTALIYLIKYGLSKIKKKLLILLIRLSTQTITDKNRKNKTAYDYYKKYSNMHGIKLLDGPELKILKGESLLDNVKSARKK